LVVKNKLLSYRVLNNHHQNTHMRKTTTTIAFCLITFFTAIVISCGETSSASEPATVSNADSTSTAASYGGFESQVKWGEHLVFIGGCNDCHTPKKMGPNGPEDDMSLMLSGHPAQQPPVMFDAKEAAKKGLVVTQTFTSWTGPWGVTYAANITSDSTGIGMWTEAQFIKAL
jgi:hypothetical protein